jgi:hypothetical protein
MPEAAIQENNEFQCNENKIWFAKQMIITPPATDSGFSQQRNKFQFRGLVARTADS